jgi:peptidyl-tRNA hydrolase
MTAVPVLLMGLGGATVSLLHGTRHLAAAKMEDELQQKNNRSFTKPRSLDGSTAYYYILTQAVSCFQAPCTELVK